MIFRGVSDKSYHLVTGIGRLTFAQESDRARYEQEVLAEFKKRSLPHLKSVPSSNLEWLQLAQHYGIPTRLLDWSHNPLVALYFAAEKADNADFAVYKSLHTRWLAEDYEPFEIGDELGMEPRHCDVRYINQAGVFTIHPSYKLENTEHLIKYVFPAESKHELRWLLRRLGFSPASMFPSLDGIARDVVAQCEPMLNKNYLRSTNYDVTRGIA
jgi:hypothetical protein